MNLRLLKFGLAFLYGVWFLMFTIYIGLLASGRLYGGILLLETGLVNLPIVASSLILFLVTPPARTIRVEHLTEIRRALIVSILSMALTIVLLIVLGVGRTVVMALGIVVVTALVMSLPYFRGQAGSRQ